MVDKLTYFVFIKNAMLKSNNVKNIIISYPFIKFANFPIEICDFLLIKTLFRSRSRVLLVLNWER